MARITKAALTSALNIATNISKKALESPDTMAFLSKLASQKNETRTRLVQLAEKWEKSLPDLRTGSQDRATEREMCARELRLALEEQLFTVSKEEAEEHS